MNTTAPITVQTIVVAPLEKVWSFWTDPKHIVGWAFASNDWEAPRAENDVRSGGKFLIVMAARDKSASFDFVGTYTNIELHKKIEYTIADGRNVAVVFSETPSGTLVQETFDPEHINPPEKQREGWQAILNNFKKYTERTS